MSEKAKSLKDAPESELKQISDSTNASLKQIVAGGRSERWKSGLIAAAVSFATFSGISLLARKIGSNWLRFSSEEIGMATVISGASYYEMEKVRQQTALQGKFGLDAESILRQRAEEKAKHIHEKPHANSVGAHEHEAQEAKHDHVAHETQAKMHHDEVQNHETPNEHAKHNADEANHAHSAHERIVHKQPLAADHKEHAHHTPKEAHHVSAGEHQGKLHHSHEKGLESAIVA